MSLKDARAYFKAENRKVKRTSLSSARTISAAQPEITPEIRELARGLENDPLAIFDYVHDHVEFEPYYGLRKGPTLTMLDGAGNDFDQASLLVSLLRAGGHTARYAIGDMAIPIDKLANWVAVEEDGDLVETVLAHAGIPYYRGFGADDQSMYLVSRIWVQAIIDGETFQLDPAFKQYRQYERADIAALLGYDRNQFLASVQNGATVTADFVQNLNDANLRAELAAYSANLAENLQSQYPNSSLDEISGGREIVAAALESLPLHPEFSSSVEDLWEEIPPAFVVTFRVQLEGIDHTFKSFEIGGKRLTITYDSGRPQLRLNGALIAEGNPVVHGQSYLSTLSIDHPLAANDGSYGDQEVPAALESGANHVHVIFNGLSASPQTIEHAQKRLAAFINQNHTPDSETLVGETLNILGMRMVYQNQLVYRLIQRTHGMLLTGFHSFGWMKQDDSVKVDWGGNVYWSTRRQSNIPDIEIDASEYVGVSVGSGLEHGIIEQIYGPAIPGLSTIKMHWLQNSRGGKIYLANSSNYGSIEPALNSSYSANKLADFQDEIDKGQILLVPENGSLALEQWSGYGYTSFGPEHIGFFISGGLFGGFSAVHGRADYQRVNDMRRNKRDSNTFSIDPVDLRSGFFLFDRIDLSVNADLPLGIPFARSYNSGRVDVPSGMGWGWTHNLARRAIVRSKGSAVLGANTAMVSVAPLTYSHVMVDLFKHLVGCPDGHCASYKQDALGIVLISLGAKWLMDQTVNNTVVVKTGKDSLEFVKLPDGSFAAPPGATVSLQQESNGGYALLERSGTRHIYDSEGRLVSVGAGRSFQFDGFDRLTGISGDLNLQYRYDAMGNRMARIEGGIETRYVYDENRNLLIEAGEDNRIKHFYIHGMGLLAMVDENGGVYTYHFNGNANTVAISDETETVVNRYAYAPFGRPANRAEKFDQPFTFVGQYGIMKESSDLYYMRARYYDARIGRFISQDPIGFDGGDVNLFRYASNNPILYFDPNGNITWTQVGGGYFSSLQVRL